MYIVRSVTSIGRYAFYDCRNLASIEVDNSNINYSSQDGILYNKEKTEIVHIPVAISGNVSIPEGITNIDLSMLNYCNNLESITIESGNTTYASIDGVLYNKAKTEIICVPKAIKNGVKIPNGVKIINEEAFAGRITLTSIEIPSSVTNIGDYAFSECSSLTNIKIPSSVTYIGYGAFKSCSNLTSIDIPTSVTTICWYAFDGCNKLTIYCEVSSKPAGFMEYGWNDWNGESRPVVWNCIEHGVTNQGLKWGLTKDKIMLIAGYNGASTELVIPTTINGYNVTNICDFAFNDCGDLTRIEIPNSITHIGRYAFYDCSSLTNINIPDSIDFIDVATFYNCSS